MAAASPSVRRIMRHFRFSNDFGGDDNRGWDDAGAFWCVGKWSWPRNALFSGGSGRIPPVSDAGLMN
jgi:hypothetical protein